MCMLPKIEPEPGLATFFCRDIDIGDGCGRQVLETKRHGDNFRMLVTDLVLTCRCHHHCSLLVFEIILELISYFA